MSPVDTTALSAALATVQQYVGCGRGDDEWLDAYETIASHVAEHAGELVRVRPLELTYFGYGRWQIPTLFGVWELHHYGRDDGTDAWMLDFMDGGRCQEHDTKDSAIAAANNANRDRLSAVLEPLVVTTPRACQENQDLPPAASSSRVLNDLVLLGSLRPGDVAALTMLGRQNNRFVVTPDGRSCQWEDGTMFPINGFTGTFPTAWLGRGRFIPEGAGRIEMDKQSPEAGG